MNKNLPISTGSYFYPSAYLSLLVNRMVELCPNVSLTVLRLSAIIVFSAIGLTSTLTGCSGVGQKVSAVQNEGQSEDPALSALDNYIHNDDKSFRWEMVSESTDGKGTGYVVKMTSQTWHDIVWQHSMYIIEPAQLTNPESCTLYITGGANGNGPRESDMQSAQLIANLSGMYVAVLWQVPNQPLLGDFTEDGLITETFLKMLETGDESWPLLFPMAKSAVRAMDAVQELLKKQNNRDIKGFVVFGASKRGWTTWLTAATKDPRVIAIAPMVINVLNMQTQASYQMTNWGFYREQIADYYSRHLLADQIDPSAPAAERELHGRLWRMIDPY
ncbi:MAG: PhoPQ-activated pathogenicity-related family protein, partial [Tannerella sp.]|nr:PhoPQ-activated pathogenicity-related family protein [Tannerella sp.]